MKPIRELAKVHAQATGRTPALVLMNPRYPHNVGAALRAASCYGVSQVFYTGDRITAELEKKKRLPREERMKGYLDVDLINYEYPFDCFANASPVAVEVNPSASNLVPFVHPDNAIYVFGPEDGSIPSATLRHCHQVVIIPTRHCLNLATAVATVLYDRHAKRILAGHDPLIATRDLLDEQRGFLEPLDDPLFARED